MSLSQSEREALERSDAIHSGCRPDAETCTTAYYVALVRRLAAEVETLRALAHHAAVYNCGDCHKPGECDKCVVALRLRPKGCNCYDCEKEASRGDNDT